MDNVSRRLITDHVLSHVETNLGKPVGDADIPDGAGYQGEWGKSTFVPYVVITPEGAGQGDGPLDDSQSDITFTYSITGFGLSRKQCEGILDKTRNLLFDMKRDSVAMDGGTNRKIRHVWVTAYGNVERSDGVEPPWWAGTDAVALDTTPD